ncbi:MAG: hypothetical protein IT323_21470 [Anaerolineae bacterium]|nr:hypothetical protein [Anaerolineae bacterium]
MRIFLALVAFALVAAGCGMIAPQPTPEPIFVTATPEILPPTATVIETPATPTPVIAALALSATALPLPTATDTPRPTRAATLTPSFTPSLTETPIPTGLAGLAAGGVYVPGACSVAAAGGFATILGRDPALQASLGCAVGPAVPINAAYQDFEGGRMIWASSLGDAPGGVIYAAYNTGSYQRFSDTWVESVDGVAAPGGEGAPEGRTAPIRGFGKVWGQNPPVRSALGWAVGGENGTGAQIQRFERGEMVYVGGLGTFLFVGPGSGSWRLDGTAF